MDISPRRDDLIRRMESALTVRHGRREGERGLDHRLPSLETSGGSSARWRLATSDSRLYPTPVENGPLQAWRSADGKKGRRPVAADLHNDNRLAAILAWHFEAKPTRGARRPHLITAAAVRKDLEDQALRAEYLVALWLLMCVVSAIDRKTCQLGHVELVRDTGIALTTAEITHIDLQRGRTSDEYKGDYYTFPA